jgi:hypothetical protein
LGGNISEYGIGKLACYLDYVALDARDETVDRTTSLMTVAGKRFTPDWGSLHRSRVRTDADPTPLSPPES